ncbi:MAG TPA: hypothetical protein PKA90_04365 [Ignavibacteria bacterium]|nr:hypothetical protein [Ignavibacteria bacterium]HMR39644.1 hypothetical protein [Ignavibacteria bacterium]
MISVDEIMKVFPELEADDIKTVLLYAAK